LAASTTVQVTFASVESARFSSTVVEVAIQTTDVDSSTSDTAVDCAPTGSALSAEGVLSATLALVLSLAETTVAGCDFAGIFAPGDDLVTTPLCTDRIVMRIDALQRWHGEGPGLAVLAQREMLYAEDLADDSRWPTCGPPAARAGIRSVLALPVIAGGRSAALILYGRGPRAFGATDRGTSRLLAAFAGDSLSAARIHQADERLAANLQGALASRTIIGQAQGILMEREHITADRAFDVLRESSQHLNIKLREVAQILVDSGENPETRQNPDRLPTTDHIHPGQEVR
jgi:GAF domain-containing protein